MSDHNTLKHAFDNPQPDQAGPHDETLPSDWNHQHIFAGGTIAGQVLTWEPAENDNARFRTIVAGAGVTVTVNAGNITIAKASAGEVDGSGTAGFIPKWVDSNTLTDSIMSDDGSKVTVAGNFTVTSDVKASDYLITTDFGIGAAIDGGQAGTFRSVVTYAPNAASVPLSVIGAAAQTGDLQWWQDSVFNVLAKVTATGRIRVPDGDEAAPSYSFVSATGTGMWRDGTSLAWSLAGTQTMTLDPTTFFVLPSGGTPTFAFGTQGPDGQIGFRINTNVDTGANQGEVLSVGGGFIAVTNDGGAFAGIGVGLSDLLNIDKGGHAVSVFAGVYVNGSNITASGAGTIDVASSIHVTAAPTVGVENYAIRVVSGDVKLGGTLFCNDIQGFSPLVIKSPAIDKQALVIKPFSAGQTANTFEVRDDGNSPVLRVDNFNGLVDVQSFNFTVGAFTVVPSTGNASTTGTISAGTLSGTTISGVNVVATNWLSAGGSGDVVMTIIGAPSQTGDFLNINTQTPTTVFAVTATGGVKTAGTLTFSAAASRIVPGATSLTIRNHADGADNIIILDNGNTTFNGVLTSAGGGINLSNSGDLTLIGGKINFTAATSRIVPGATSLSIRNSANGADNLLIADAGDVTVRNNLTVTGILTAGTYTGQSSIVTLGTITTGVWTGTAIAAANGGTGQTSYAVGDLLYASASTTLSKLADVATGSYLRSGGVTTAPLWSTLVLPNAATANRVVYATSTNVWGDSANLTYDGTSFVVGTVGPHAIGGATAAATQINIQGTFAATGGAGNAFGLEFGTALQPQASQDAALMNIDGTLVEAGSGTHGTFSGLRMNVQFTGAAAATTDFAGIRVLAGSVLDSGVTTASGIKVTAPSGAGTNYSLWSVAGVNKFGGSVGIGTDPTGLFHIAGADATMRIEDTTGGSGRVWATQATANIWQLRDLTAGLIYIKVGGSNDAILMNPAFTPGAGFGFLDIAPSLTPPVNGSTFIVDIAGAVTEAGSGTHAFINGLRVDLSITAGAATTTDVAGIFVNTIAAASGTTNVTGIKVNTPSGATNLYALWATGDGPSIINNLSIYGNVNASGVTLITSEAVTNTTGRDLQIKASGGDNGIYIVNSTAKVLLGGSAGTFTYTNAGGVQLGAPTGGDKGSGTINAAGAYWANGTAGVSAGSFSAVTAITTVNGIVTQLTGTSDERLKDVTGPYGLGLVAIRAIGPVRYTWKPDNPYGIDPGRERVGFTVQGVMGAIPEVMDGVNAEGYYDFNPWPILAVAVNAVKELDAQAVDHANRIMALEAEVATLREALTRRN